MLKTGKYHTNNLQFFSKAENDVTRDIWNSYRSYRYHWTPLTEYGKKTINPAFNSLFQLQCCCKDIKIPS